jgi:hypothetical protein
MAFSQTYRSSLTFLSLFQCYTVNADRLGEFVPGLEHNTNKLFKLGFNNITDILCRYIDVK